MSAKGGFATPLSRTLGALLPWRCLPPGETVWRARFSPALKPTHVAHAFRAEWEAFVGRRW